MAVDWNDPMLWLAGAGTSLGALGGLYSTLQGRSSYDDLVNAAQRQQREAMSRQQQAIDFMRQREAAMQALAAQPYDINSYQAPMQQQQIDAVRRESLANQLMRGLPPDVAQRMFMTEILPKMIQSQYMDASGIAQQHRAQQLAAMGWLPSAQTLAGGVPGADNTLAAMSRFPNGGAGAFGGDVSSLGQYLKGQQLRQDQMNAQNAARTTQQQWLQAIGAMGGMGGRNGNGIPGQSGYDSHRDRLGFTGLNTESPGDVLEGGI